MRIKDIPYPPRVRASAEIQLASGPLFDVLNPDPSLINIDDIALALSNTPRFGGHTSSFYSVAQHSVLVSYLVPPEQALAALLHDCPEAYLLDMVTPIKSQLPDYKAVYAEVERACKAAFGVEWDTPAIHYADRVALATEKRDLMPAGGWSVPGVPRLKSTIKPLWPYSARLQFINRYNEVRK